MLTQIDCAPKHTIYRPIIQGSSGKGDLSGVEIKVFHHHPEPTEHVDGILAAVHRSLTRRRIVRHLASIHACVFLLNIYDAQFTAYGHEMGHVGEDLQQKFFIYLFSSELIKMAHHCIAVQPSPL
jgi:hypothetical protein